MKFNNDFVGYDIVDVEMPWISADDESRYLENCKKQPIDWYYRNLKFTYKHNHNGHRSKNIEEIDLDNYILFTGCSHTEGVGMELEKSYPYMVSKALKCDYYNLALSATGPDILEYNLVTWFSKVPKLPKLVVVQWPDYARFASMNPLYPTILTYGTWIENDDVKRMIVLGEGIGYLNARKQICLNIIKSITKSTKLITLSFNNMTLYNNDTLFIKRHDFARDMSHAGVKSHELWTKQILEHI